MKKSIRVHGYWLAPILVVVSCLMPTNVLAVTLQFAERTWNIKQSTSTVGPGPNRFSDNPNDVWADEDGLHLTIDKYGSNWFCTEVILNETLGYGTYMFQTTGRQDILNANATFVPEHSTFPLSSIPLAVWFCLRGF